MEYILIIKQVKISIVWLRSLSSHSYSTLCDWELNPKPEHLLYDVVMEAIEPVEPQSLKKLSFKSLKRALDLFSPVHQQLPPPDAERFLLFPFLFLILPLFIYSTLIPFFLLQQENSCQLQG